MKKIKFIIIGSGLAILSLVTAVSCEKSANTVGSDELASLKSVLTGYFEEDGLSCVYLPEKFQEVTEEEIAMLNRMKEEEKLARDVYKALGEEWGIPVFNNISSSEERHLQAVLSLLRIYSPSDTIVPDAGVFSAPEVQDLYNELVAKGTASLADALITGATIEDLDIKDLSEYLDKTDNEYMEFVFSNIRRGSFNHMKAFTAHLRARGIDYIPQFISQDLYDEIIGTE